MTEAIEIEFKNMLTEDQFKDLLTKYKGTDDLFVSQTNYYFDTQSSNLRNRHAGLRIRITDTYAEQTLKIPATIGLLEITDKLNLTDSIALAEKGKIYLGGDVEKKLSQMEVDVNKLQLVATLKTKRFEKQLEDYLLVLDESWYGDHHDFELEMEVNDYSKGKDFFLNFLAVHKIKIKPAKNKVQRAISANYEK